jgi:hypothetical protein
VEVFFAAATWVLEDGTLTEWTWLCRCDSSFCILFFFVLIQKHEKLGIPSDNDTYVHRVGRTARAGTNGEAICLCFDFEKAHFFAR